MKTILYQEHVNLNAKIVDFAGWQMPLQYEGILLEHAAVRKNAGIFDVSHMGAIHIKGPESETFLNFLSANFISGKPIRSATYTVLCNEDGGSVEDTLIYKLQNDHFFIVANAANRQKDLEHVKKYARNYNVHVEEHYQNDGILALQGPNSKDILQNLFPQIDLKPMRLQTATLENKPLILSRTGYTGEIGYEIFASNDLVPILWNALLSFGATPCGLGARDTLRLEKGYALYGHELSEEISPLESVAAWIVKMDSHDFLGKAMLQNQIGAGHRHAYGLKLHDQAIPRNGFPVLKEGKEIGKITSGNFSPTLNCPIALILSAENLKSGDYVDVMIREKSYPAEVTPLPFI